MSGSAPASKILVSACLVGIECNHRGLANTSDAVRALAAEYDLIAVCPETQGGLPTPRPAAEVQDDGRVVNEAGDDVTAAFVRGAHAALAVAQAAGVTQAVLKARSPSCDPGRGITAAALRAAGVRVRCEEDDLTLE